MYIRGLIAALALAGAANAADVEWPTYAADLAASRYRPLGEIDATNFSKLEVAWRFKTDNIGPRPEFRLQGTPLMVGGVIYATAGSRRGVVALDAATGELLWVHSVDEGARAAAAPRQLSGRGLSWWKSGSDERILYVTPGYRLIALDARTGQRVASFGKAGEIDLKTDWDQDVDLETGEAGYHAAPLIAGDVVVIGAAFREGRAPARRANTKGYVRAYDVRTGKRLWTFHTIPQRGEPGYETWLNGSAETTGNTGVWTQMSADPELGLVYLPVEAPTGDYFGGHRPGANLYSDSLVALDLKTGQRKWHFQLVHHELWDYDNTAAPMLMDVTQGGKPVKAVALPTKQGLLYVFDRATGKPVWPIVERKVARGDVPGEWYAPTQPIPTKPAAYARNGVTPDDLIDFTPALRAKAQAVAKAYRTGPIFTPPPVAQVGGPYGLIQMPTGGSNWPGGSFDPETHTAYLFACNACLSSYGLTPPKAGASDLPYVAALPAGATPPPLNVEGLPLLKPPYATITAIDLDSGDHVWQIAHGETPDLVRDHAALKGRAIPRTGQAAYNIGTLVTKTLVIAGDPQATTPPGRPRGAMLRAYDKGTGKEVGAVWMPAPQSGSPMTYSLNGRQYIVVAISGGAYSGEYVAYALPPK